MLEMLIDRVILPCVLLGLVVDDEIVIFYPIEFVGVPRAVGRNGHDVVLHGLGVREHVHHFLVQNLKNQLLYVNVWETFEYLALFEDQMGWGWLIVHVLWSLFLLGTTLGLLSR